MERWEYGDPENVAERREEARQRADRACGNCEHAIGFLIKNELIKRCEFKRYEYGIRCKNFKSKGIK